VNQVIKNPKLIEVLISTIDSEKGSIKFSCEKTSRKIHEEIFSLNTEDEQWFSVLEITSQKDSFTDKIKNMNPECDSECE